MAQTTNPDLLVTIQKASQPEVDSYNTADLELGLLVYNTDENRIYEYTNQGWLKLLTASNIHVDAFEIRSADGFSLNVTYTSGEVSENNNDPFRPVRPTDINTESLLVLFTAYR